MTPDEVKRQMRAGIIVRPIMRPLFDAALKLIEQLEAEKREADKAGWDRAMEKAPKDRFIFLFCEEDGSRWLAKWQGERWYGVDDEGLTREGHSAGDPEVVTGWAVTHWRELPTPPSSNTGMETKTDDRCIACDVAFKPGELVYNDASGGTIHAKCCGPEREGFTGADGGPLKIGEPKPAPYQWWP